jgi:hypothetical protein
MTEINQIIEGQTIAYEGLFNATELYQVIDSWFRNMHYDKREMENREAVKEHGRYIHITLRPWRKVTDVEKFEIKIRIRIEDMEDVVVERDGLKMAMNKGKVLIIFDAYFTSDYEERWEQKPFYFFISHFIDKFIYKVHTDNHIGLLRKESSQLIREVKSYLNMHKY